MTDRDLTEVRAGFTAVQGEHNVQQALLLLRTIANYCFKFIKKFRETYNTVAEKKKAARSVEARVSFNLRGSNPAKAELNDAEVAHRTIKDDVLIPALHELMTAFTSFSAAIGSIQLGGASEDQVMTVINDFETQIRELTDEVSVSLICSNYSSGVEGDLWQNLRGKSLQFWYKSPSTLFLGFFNFAILEDVKSAN
ncbi:hypothetical protein WR25_26818 [Diploscapter pachys]|uniref:Uncharacterized protein n=1 Tax=Diploscapter pachys TaxID=2018661 RepID=A0A2A2KL09_9BILA|nr:hypothetical protein WR25_26818 [Diploscapter pachys]